MTEIEQDSVPQPQRPSALSPLRYPVFSACRRTRRMQPLTPA